MSNEVKQRKKAGTQSNKEVKDAQQGGATPAQRAQDHLPGKVLPHSSVSGSGAWYTDFRTVLCSLCLSICAALIWTVFQHAQNFAILEQKYQSLQLRSSALEGLESKVGQIFGKLVSTEDHLAAATESSSLLSNLHNQVSKLYNDMDRIRISEQALSDQMQHVSLKTQNVTASWKRRVDEMNLETSAAKSEAKSFHQQMTLKMNAAEQTLKDISEKLKEFESSTPRNFRTVKKQEDDDVQRIRDVLDYDAKAIEDLEKQENDLANMNLEIQENMAKFQPKLEECMSNLPTIDSSVRTLLKVSNEMLNLDKKINELTVEVFTAEDNLLKIVSETLEIQNALEGMQYDNSLLKIQNEISVLKDKVQILSTNENSFPKEKELDDGER